jgi:hypothetical protein
VPESWPVEVLNVAQLGRFAIEYVSVSPFASDAVGRKLYAAFAATLVAGVPLMTGGEFGVEFTVIVNAGSATLVEPSLTLITIPANEPAAVGVPLRRPLDVLNVAQAGRFAMLNPSVLPSGSLAFGWNAYGWPAVTVVIGEPLMTGGRFAGTPCTVIANAGSEALDRPSLTLITMFWYEPTCALVGVPLKRPVALLNVVHAGALVTLNVRVSPFESDAVGWNAYAEPTVALAAGEPLITGGLFVEPVPETLIENAGSDAVLPPSVTLITMPEYVATLLADGVPLRRPVVVLNVAQEGLFEIL